MIPAFPRQRRPYRDRIWERDERLEALARRAAETARRPHRRRRRGVSIDDAFSQQWEAEVKAAFQRQGFLLRAEVAGRDGRAAP